MLNLFQYLIPLFGFQWLRRFYACGVSRCAVSMATPFEWLRRFSLRCLNGYAVYVASPFLGLTSLRASPFYACGV